MDFSSSSSSSSSHYRSGSSVSPAHTTTPLPIYDTAPHFPPMEAREISSSSNSSPCYPNYAYQYSNHHYSGGAERMEEAVDRAAEEQEQEREHMFDKIVTPSDVGKLNRLVIPKQHAEKYFPLDASSSDKGLLLDFEDRTGKSWRFRYSYWNSSQSYVMTKGWSRFVKEKKLDAGDVVSFHRARGEPPRDHFYIDWRRRPHPPHPPPQIQFHQHQHRLLHHHPPFLLAPPTLPNLHPQPPLGSLIGYNTLGGYNYGLSSPNFFRQAAPVVYMRGPPPPQMQMPAPSRRSIPAASSSGAQQMVLDSVPLVVQSTPGRNLRLFGVNMVTEGQANPTTTSSRHSADEEAVEESLQLSLIHAGTGESSTTTTTTELPEKGKSSSMSLDFDL